MYCTHSNIADTSDSRISACYDEMVPYPSSFATPTDSIRNRGMLGPDQTITSYYQNQSLSAMKYNVGGARNVPPPSCYEFLPDTKRAPGLPIWDGFSIPIVIDDDDVNNAEMRKPVGDIWDRDKKVRSMQRAAIDISYRESNAPLPAPPPRPHRGQNHGSQRDGPVPTSTPNHRHEKASGASEFFLAEAEAVRDKIEWTFGANGTGSLTSSGASTSSTFDHSLLGLDSLQNSLSSDIAIAPNPMISPLDAPHVNVLVYNDGLLQHGELPPPPRSTRKPLGLAYALRKTDSASTFQSLDGLSNSYPLIRKEAKKRREERSKANKRRGDRQQSRSNGRSSSDKNTTLDASRFACGSPLCFPMDSVFPTESLGRRSSSSGRGTAHDSTDRSKSTREELLRLRTQLRELREKTCRSSGSSGAGPHVDQMPGGAPGKKKKRKTVRFAAPLVTKICYRPYTKQSDVALLFFQEEELEELECDRETVSGDQFECQYDEAIMSVRVAYQKQSRSDE